jgi:CRP-like cAMP-binding protein
MARKTDSELGKVYLDGETIIRQGDEGDCMYVIQEGTVEVIQHHGDTEIELGTMSAGDFFGEMALFQKETRAASVRARGEVRAMTVDKKTLLRRVKEDPLLAYNLVQTMSNRIRELHVKLSAALFDDKEQE